MISYAWCSNFSCIPALVAHIIATKWPNWHQMNRVNCRDQMTIYVVSWSHSSPCRKGWLDRKLRLFNITRSNKSLPLHNTYTQSLPAVQRLRGALQKENGGKNRSVFIFGRGLLRQLGSSHRLFHPRRQSSALSRCFWVLKLAGCIDDIKNITRRWIGENFRNYQNRPSCQVTQNGALTHRWTILAKTCRLHWCSHEISQWIRTGENFSHYQYRSSSHQNDSKWLTDISMQPACTAGAKHSLRPPWTKKKSTKSKGPPSLSLLHMLMKPMGYI